MVPRSKIPKMIVRNQTWRLYILGLRICQVSLSTVHVPRFCLPVYVCEHYDFFNIFLVDGVASTSRIQPAHHASINSDCRMFSRAHCSFVNKSRFRRVGLLQELKFGVIVLYEMIIFRNNQFEFDQHGRRA
jgi:hypothetical protein